MLPHILKIIDSYQGKKQKIFLFLHRSDGFSEADVQGALQNSNVDKCFLFSNGRDFIYFSTQSIGLLGLGRSFHYEPAINGQAEVKVADEKLKVVFQPYFNKVWYYYEHEFATKITEIRSDLLYHLWTKSYPDDRIWTTADFEKLLRENDMLYLRIRNLLDEEYNLTEVERRQLIEWEIKQQKSFVFDDCRENMERLNGVKKEYDILHQKLVNIFFDSQSGYATSKPIFGHIQDLCDDFDKLLEVISDN